MVNYIKVIWERLTAPKPIDELEVERIAALQLAATQRRAEHANNRDRTDQGGDSARLGQLAVSRERVLEAESAHLAALQRWENKQARQKSK